MHTIDSNEAGPLAGLRVVDMTTSYAGPTAAMYLADLGADVVKVERPSGDDARSWGPPFVDDDTSAWFASANRNKRSVALDVSRPEGQDALRRLLAEADVFIQNVNPAKLRRLGIDGPTLREHFPRLVCCSLSGFGLDGPDAQLPGYDLVAQARSGLMSVTGAKGGRPQRVSTALSDIVTGMCATIAICAAVVRQRSTGEGDLVDVSLLDSDLALMAPRIASYLAGEPEPAPSGGTDSVLAVYQTFGAVDREIVVAIGNDIIWRRFCDAVGLPELADDPSLVGNAARRSQRDRLVEAISAVLATKPAAEWIALLSDASVPCALVQHLSEVVADSQVVARGSLLPVPGSASGVSVHSPFRLASIPVPRNDRFPALGEHTLGVLIEAGFTPDEADRLMADGVACGPLSSEVAR
ncbi:CaiB/BaiF CoA transferase family protein [Aeromicrobium wangtongii]|uniref:CaiB/BaiF CoA transferase family protein n=1 Tax=Aeromicrobium wangtongii TaxID=2969247 RepID=UPI0020182C27|nr:CoA transferase [Aeromicrobium wangtongii]MCL3819385.1 CoA transferase [Aeromicrobium wangtongii]